MTKYIGKRTEILALRPLIERGCKVSIDFSQALGSIIIMIYCLNSNQYKLVFDPIIGYWDGLRKVDAGYFDYITSSKNLGDLINYIMKNEAIKP